MCSERRRALIGRSATVLFEETSSNDPGELLGRTEGYRMEVFAGADHLVGSFTTVALE